MTRRTIPLAVPGVTEAEVAVGARVVGVEEDHCGCDGLSCKDPLYTIAVKGVDPQGRTERRRWHVVVAVRPPDNRERRVAQGARWVRDFGDHSRVYALYEERL